MSHIPIKEGKGIFYEGGNIHELHNNLRALSNKNAPLT